MIFMALSIFMLNYLILICCVIAGLPQREEELLLDICRLVATLSRSTFLPIKQQIYDYCAIDATNPKHDIGQK